MTDRRNPSAFRGLLPLAVVLILGASPASAQEPTPLQKFLGNIGLLEVPEDPIEYRERAPLVVPPSSALIAPRNPNDIRQSNPDWPIDHDSRRASAVDPAAQRQADQIFYEGERMGAAGLQRGRLSRAEDARREAKARGQQTAGELEATGQVRLGPVGLGFKGWNKKEEERVVFTGEPERQTLTDPPPGLRTPSFDAPYGVVTERPDPNRLLGGDRSAHPDDPANQR